jgi:hypothetical protein
MVLKPIPSPGSASILWEDFMNPCDSVIRTLAAFGIIVAMASVTFADDILQYTGAGSAARALFPANDQHSGIAKQHRRILRRIAKTITRAAGHVPGAPLV